MTRVFNLLGAGLPKNLMAPAPTNEAGHWESNDLMAIHDDLLASTGSRWDDWRAFNPDWYASNIAESYRLKLLNVLQKDFAESQLFVIKDPRICRFVPLWLDVLKRFDAETHIVITIRNPLEVAMSLKQRNDILPSKSHLLWLRHVLDAERETRNLDRAIASYDGLLDDWRRVVSTVAEKTGLHWPRRSDSSELEIDRFLATKYRHHVVDTAQLAARADISGWVKEAYRLLGQMAGQGESAAALKHLDRIRGEFDNAAAAFGLVFADEAERSARVKNDEIAQSVSKLQSAHSAVTAREREGAQLAAAVKEAQVAAQRSDTQITLLTEELEASREAVRARDLALGAAEKATTDVQSRLDSILAASAELERERANLTDELREAQAAAMRGETQVALLAEELKAAQAAAKERDLAAADSEKRIVQIRGQLDATRNASEEIKREGQRLVSELQEAHAASARIREEREGLDRERSRLLDQVHEVRVLLTEREQEKAQLMAAIGDTKVEMANRGRDIKKLSDDLKLEQALRRQRDGDTARLAHELDAARLFLRDSQTDVQRLSGELDESQREVARVRAEHMRMQNEMADTAAELQLVRSRVVKFQVEVDGLKSAARQLQATRDELASTKLGLEGAIKKLSESDARANNLLGEMGRVKSELAGAQREIAQLAGQSAELEEARRAHRASDDKAAGFERDLAIARSLLEELQGTLEAQSRSIKSESGRLRRQRSSIWRAIARKFRRSGGGDGDGELNQWEHDLLRKSKLFDAVWYLRHNPDVAAAGQDSLWHYIFHGAAEGREPHPLFDTAWYRSQASDIDESKMTSLAHYASIGVAKGLDPHPLFDTDYYLRQNPEVAAAHINPLYHFVKMGAANGLNPNPLFDSLWYLEKYPDVAAARENPLNHYIAHGAAEARDPHPLFDTRWYIERNPDVAKSRVNPLQHYLKTGAAEGLSPNPLFDAAWYLRQNPDVANAGVNPLVHYLMTGYAEGRDPHPLFSSAWYLKQYSNDIPNGMNPLAHYLWHGGFKGCNPNPLFDSEGYLSQNREAEAARINPLVDYLSKIGGSV